MLPRAEDTTTLRPLRSATLSIFEPGGTRMAMPRAELRRAAMIFSGVPPVALARLRAAVPAAPRVERAGDEPGAEGQRSASRANPR